MLCLRLDRLPRGLVRGGVSRGGMAAYFMYSSLWSCWSLPLPSEGAFGFGRAFLAIWDLSGVYSLHALRHC